MNMNNGKNGRNEVLQNVETVWSLERVLEIYTKGRDGLEIYKKWRMLSRAPSGALWMD